MAETGCDLIAVLEFLAGVGAGAVLVYVPFSLTQSYAASSGGSRRAICLTSIASPPNAVSCTRETLCRCASARIARAQALPAKLRWSNGSYAIAKFAINIIEDAFLRNGVDIEGSLPLWRQGKNG
jgi:hypothetical protein